MAPTNSNPAPKRKRPSFNPPRPKASKSTKPATAPPRKSSTSARKIATRKQTADSDDDDDDDDDEEGEVEREVLDEGDSDDDEMDEPSRPSLDSADNDEDDTSKHSLPPSSTQDPPPTIPPALLTKLLHHHFQNDKTKIGVEARGVVGKYIETFVREAIARATFERQQAGDAGVRGVVGDDFLEVEDLEKLAPQLLLDF